MKSMNRVEADMKILTDRSEVEFQTKLNITSRSGRRNLAKGRVGRSVRSRKGPVTEIWRSEVGAIEGVEHVRLKPQVEPLGNPKLFPHRKVPGLQVGPLHNSYGRIAAAAERRRGKGCRINPTVRPFIGKQHRTTEVVGAARPNRGAAGRRKISAALETGNAADFPTGKQCALRSFGVLEKRQMIIVRSHEDVPPIKRSRPIVVVTIEWVFARVQPITVATGIRQVL